MEDSYIQNAVMQFLYRELSARETIELTELMVATPEVRVMFRRYSSAKSQLPKALFNPSAGAVNNVLRYSAQTALQAN